MPGPVNVRNAVDCNTMSGGGQTAKVQKQSTQVWLHTAHPTLGTRYGWYYFTMPFPRGARIISARFRVWSANVMASRTYTTRRAAAKWQVNRITNANKPAVVGAIASVTQPVGLGDVVDSDVTELMQEVSDGQPWYGFRLEASGAAVGRFQATESRYAGQRPSLVVTWSEPPDEPDDLKPSDGQAISTQRTVLTYDYNDVTGEADLDAHHVQISSSEAELLANTPDWDSGEVPTTLPTFNAGALYPGATPVTTWPGLADTEEAWWRVRAQDGSGDWSPWSDPKMFVRMIKGSLAITSGGVIWEPSPTVTWDFTVRTQTAYQVTVEKVSALGLVIYSSGRVISAEEEHTIPFGIINDPDELYRIRVTIWDDQNRVAALNDPITVSAFVDCPVQYDAAVANVTGLSMASEPFLPIASLSFGSAVAPDTFVLQRSVDDGATWRYIDEAQPDELELSPGLYTWLDATTPNYKPVVWRVLSVVGGHQSTGASVEGEVRRRSTFLYGEGGIDPVCFLNPDRDMGFSDVHGVHEPLGGDVVVVTQRLGKRRGSVSGRLTEEALENVSSKESLERFLRHRGAIGRPTFLTVADEIIKITAYNFAYNSFMDPYGVWYEASFDWVEVS